MEIVDRRRNWFYYPRNFYDDIISYAQCFRCSWTRWIKHYANWNNIFDWWNSDVCPWAIAEENIKKTIVCVIILQLVQ